MPTAWGSREFSQAVERTARRQRWQDDEARVASAIAGELVAVAKALAAEAFDGLDRGPGITGLLAKARRTAKRTARELGW